jgi:hypothetical protein
MRQRVGWTHAWHVGSNALHTKRRVCKRASERVNVGADCPAGWLRGEVERMVERHTFRRTVMYVGVSGRRLS